MILSKKQITKALISLPGCADWSAPVLFPNPRRQVFLCQGPYVKINKLFELKNVNIFISINFNMCFGCSKETVLLSTLNICFVLEIRNIILSYALLYRGMCDFGTLAYV